jgi:hypothetical protein
MRVRVTTAFEIAGLDRAAELITLKELYLSMSDLFFRLLQPSANKGRMLPATERKLRRKYSLSKYRNESHLTPSFVLAMLKRTIFNLFCSAYL